MRLREKLSTCSPFAAGLFHRSRVTGRGSQVAGHRSRVTGHRSRVTGCGSQVTGHRSQIYILYYYYLLKMNYFVTKRLNYRSS